MELITNPLSDPQFWSFLIRTFLGLGAGLLIMVLSGLGNLSGMVKSLGFKKYLSWLVILPALLLIAHSGRGPALVFIVALLWVAGAETTRMLRIRPFYKKVFQLHQLVTVLVMIFSPSAVLMLPIYYVVATFFAAGVHNRRYRVVDQISFVIIASLWISFVLALFSTFTLQEPSSAILTTVFGVVVLSDVFAYLFGGFGRKLGLGTAPLATNISPNKVVAGVVGNIFGASLALLAYGSSLGFGWIGGAIVATLAGVAAAYGDLAESIIKRHAGVKDSSNLIPFHGGMMDRIDSLLFVVPLIYVALNVSLSWPF